MYIPAYYKNTDLSSIKAFIRKYAFAQLISYGENFPFVSHIPVEMVEREGGDFFLQGHVSRANPQWKGFSRNPKVLVVYSGPHTYVSSGWYNHVNVPTWNYMAVHVSGEITPVEGDELWLSLKDLVDKYESGSTKPVRVEDMPAEMMEKYMKGIVGFRIEPEKIEGKWKLSQNRDDEDFANIIRELEKINETNAKLVAEEMKTIKRKKDN